MFGGTARSHPGLGGLRTGPSTGANFFEGAAAAPTLTNTTADFRLMGGLQDTNDNSVDFSRAAPNPRNTSSPANVPEPGSIALVALGLAGFGPAIRKRSLNRT
jgi:hypothetical protein